MSTSFASYCRRYKKTFLLIVNIIAIISAVTFLEIVLEVRDTLKYRPEKSGNVTQSIRLRQWNINIDKTVVPEEQHLRISDNLVRKEYRLRTDELGMLLPARVHANPDKLIVFLGGSTTECLLVDEGDRFPCLVGQILGKKLGQRINSCNAGFGGNHSIHSINRLINQIIPLKPDIVVMMHNINDLAVLLYEDGLYWNAHPTRSLIHTNDKYIRPSPVPSPSRRIKDLANTFYPSLYRRLAAMKNRVNTGDEEQQEPTVDEWAHIRGKQINVDARADVIADEFRMALKLFVSTCKTWQIVPVLMTQSSRIIEKPDLDHLSNRFKNGADRHGIRYAQFRGMHGRFNQIIRDVATENGILFVDLDNGVPQEKAYMYDMVHLTGKGSKFVASIIADELSKIMIK